ncbi:MAG: lysophospholipid acyltransferase family protein [Bacteroidales bacterium]|jgi:putative hemolysin|nr:lysophospholipid acyltransferase family protein [Bacteroidales bacterium]
MGRKLVNNSQLKKVLKVKGPAGNVAAFFAMHLSGLSKLNRIYKHIYEYRGLEFADKVLEYLNVRADFDESELDRIPREGAFIIVSNHPYGAIDGLMIFSRIGKVRPDIKSLSNFILSSIPNLSDLFLPVNPFTDNPGLKSSLKGLRMAVTHLKEGGALCLFPAGEVSSNGRHGKIVQDIVWKDSVMKIIAKAEVPVIPLFFGGQNSALFHFLGKIHPLLRTIRLPMELANKKDKVISFKIGAPVLPSELDDFSDPGLLGRYLRNRTYALELMMDDCRDGCNSTGMHEGECKYSTRVTDSVEAGALCEEIESIRKDILFSENQYEAFLTDYDNIPNLMKEISIQREIAFRAVGEGTGNSFDTDSYDPYYKHLILWDKNNCALVGAFRLGFAKEIIEKFGLGGLYTDFFFRYRESFIPHLQKSIELGRSFINVSYQRDNLSLMLLLRALFFSIFKYKEIRYLIGPVSISSWIPPFYRGLIVYYLRKRHAFPHYVKDINPKMPYSYDFKRVNPGDLLLGKMSSVERFDRFLYKFSGSKFRMPPLLKKYLKVNARIIDFNIDPDFNSCIDGLIMMDLTEIPKHEIDSMTPGMEDRSALYNRFGILKDDYGTGS